MLYEIAIIELPTKKEVEDGTGREKLILPPTFVLAKDPQSAAMSIAIDNAEKIKAADPSRTSVLIRPFT